MTQTRLRNRVRLVAPTALGVAALAGSLIAGIGPSTAATTSATTSSPTAGAAARACDRTPWERAVQGTPKHVVSGVRGGDYLFHNTTGFHLRVTHRTTERVVYTGKIHSSAPMRMEKVKLEKGDVATLSTDRRTITFAFANFGHLDGINFHTDCAASLTVSHLNAGSKALPKSRVYLGAHKVHPHHATFTVHRIKVKAA
jgi:hypothetical protein